MNKIIRKILIFTFFILITLFYTLISHSHVINLKYQIEQVTVQLLLMQGDEDYYCTGVVIKNAPEMSQVLTAKHCVDHNRIVYVGALKSDKYTKAFGDDLAVIYFDGSIPNKLTTRITWDNNKINDKVWHLGYPQNNEVYVNGKITNLSPINNYLTNMIVRHGCSGGGVFNENGELVGIVVAYLNSNHNAVMESLQSIKSLLNKVER